MIAAAGKLRVVIATPLGPGGQGGMDRLSDLIAETLHRQPALGIELSILTTRGRRLIPSGLFVFAHAMIKLWQMSRRRELDVLHINLAHGGSVYRKAILAGIADRAGIPYVVHLHGSRFPEFWANAGPFAQRVIATLFVKSKSIIVLGHYWEQLILSYLPNLQQRIAILPNATKSRLSIRDKISEAPVQISFLGLIGERKGTFDLLTALRAIKSEENWHATIAGNGEVERCRAHVADFGLADRVEVPGWLGSAGVEDLLSRTDIFVLPSTAENLPMSILEAFAFGIAVIATPVGAVPEVIDHGRNGLIIPVHDAASLADSLRMLIQNPELRGKIGNAAKADHAERYEIGVYVSRLASIWRAAAQGFH